MSKRLLFDFKIFNTLIYRHYIHRRSHSVLVSAACVQRFPVIGRARGELEEQVHELKVNNRIRNSRLSDFELSEKKFFDTKRKIEQKAIEEGIQESAFELDNTFEELKESFEKDFKSFKPQPRETEDDRARNCHSLRRKLDSILYLLVKGEGVWRMPQGKITEGQSLSHTADIQLKEQCGSNLSVQFLSNTPVAYHDCPSTRNKVFFIKAQHLSGNVSLNESQLEDYAWVTKEELKDYLSDKYHNDIIDALFE